MSDKYVTPADAARTLGVNERTLRRWEEDGKIPAFRTPGGKRRYDISGFTKKLGLKPRPYRTALISPELCYSLYIHSLDVNVSI